MNCQECEWLIASDEPSRSCDEHLATCVACRELAVELQANSEAMLSFAAEPMPSVWQPRRTRWPVYATWGAAAGIAALDARYGRNEPKSRIR